MNVVVEWAYAGRVRHGGHRLVSFFAVAIQSPDRAKGWELYVLDDTGLEVFAGYAPAADAALLDNALVALRDYASSEAA